MLPCSVVNWSDKSKELLLLSRVCCLNLESFGAKSKVVYPQCGNTETRETSSVKNTNVIGDKLTDNKLSTMFGFMSLLAIL